MRWTTVPIVTDPDEVKLCTDCKHCLPRERAPALLKPDIFVCGITSAPSVVNGATTYNSCEIERLAGSCRHEARNFEAIE